MTVEDPETGQEAAIYNPRRQLWQEHFRWDGVRVIGLMPTGWATIAALDMNRSIILSIRKKEKLLDRHTPR